MLREKEISASKIKKDKPALAGLRCKYYKTASELLQRFCALYVLFVQQVQVFKELEDKAHNNSNNSCQHHALYGKCTEGELRTGKADNHNNRGHYEVGGFAVIYLTFHQYADTAGSDYAEQQDAYAAHNRNGDTVNQLTELTAEGKDDCHDSSAADNPGAVNLGDCHNADVFTVGSVRSCAGKAADNVGKTVSEQRTGQARILNQVAVNNVAGYYEMADVLSQYNECGRSYNHNSVDIENWSVEMWYLEPGSVDYRLEVDDTHDSCKNITADNAEENRDDAHKAAEGNGAYNAHSQREHGNSDVDHINVITGQACHVGCNRCQLQTDNSNNCAHCCRREDDINPFGAYAMDDKGEEHEQQTENDEAGLCMVIAGGGHNQQYRRNEGKAGAQIGGNFALGDEDVEQGTQAVHEQAGGRAYLKQKRNQHGGAEHGEQMLDT